MANQFFEISQGFERLQLTILSVHFTTTFMIILGISSGLLPKAPSHPNIQNEFLGLKGM